MLDRLQMAHEHHAVRGAQTIQDSILNLLARSATTFEGSTTRRGQTGQQDSAVSRVGAPAQESACLEALHQHVHCLRAHPEFSGQI